MECPHCGDRFKVPKHYAGTEGTCKACNEAIRIPEVIPSGFVPERTITEKWLERASKTAGALFCILLIGSGAFVALVEFEDYSEREQAKLERIRSENPELYSSVEELKEEYSTSYANTRNRFHGKIVCVHSAVPGGQTTSSIAQQGLTLGEISENVLIKAYFDNTVAPATFEDVQRLIVIGEVRIHTDGIDIIKSIVANKEKLFVPMDFSGAFGNDP